MAESLADLGQILPIVKSTTVIGQPVSIYLGGGGEEKRRGSLALAERKYAPCTRQRDSLNLESNEMMGINVHCLLGGGAARRREAHCPEDSLPTKEGETVSRVGL